MMPTTTTPDTTTPFVHPSPPIHRQIQHLLWISLGLSVCIIGFSLVSFGTLSFFIAPAAFLFSLIHHITVLVLSRKENKAGPEAIAGKLPATSRKATIILAWFCTVLWAAAFGSCLALTIIYMQYGLGTNMVVPFFEWIFEMVEMVVMGVLALRCTRERQQIVGLANTAKWYQLGNYVL